ncbi:hypothetical protein LTY20_04285 [Limosilactobacillus fastidiosus]|nr:hypothetical protein [Limosilactobacillus fastidiosus]
MGPYQDAVKVVQRLNAKLIVQDHGGHFLRNDGLH